MAHRFLARVTELRDADGRLVDDFNTVWLLFNTDGTVTWEAADPAAKPAGRTERQTRRNNPRLPPAVQRARVERRQARQGR